MRSSPAAGEPREDDESITQAADSSPVVETTPPRENRHDSFIERYSHMFANDVPADQPQPTANGGLALNREHATQKPNGLIRPVAGTEASGDGEEESIEDYMAKLLQRVRGESPVSSFTAGSTTNQATERTLPMTAPTDFPSGPLTAPLGNGGDPTAPMGVDPSKRKSSMPAPQTDLEALRALANESARRAISRHALRKHRRNMITKVIVSTLAGVTSLWMMLESESWFNLQSITASVSMLVAAYWASETFRTLLDSYRVATTDETDAEIEELSAKLRSPLPIDLDTARPWKSLPLNSSSDEPAVEPTLTE
jgi:hypothetical protein